MPCICLDYFAIEKFFNSCALTIAMQQSIKIGWAGNESVQLAQIYGFMGYEPPGSVTIDIGHRNNLTAETDRLTKQFVLMYLQKTHEQGFMAGQMYVMAMNATRLKACSQINDAFRSVAADNKKIADDLRAAIEKAAKYKLAAGVGVALVGGVGGVLCVATGGGGLGFAIVGIAKTSTQSIIKTWESGSTATAVAVDFRNMEAQRLADAAVGGAEKHVGRKVAERLPGKMATVDSAKLALKKYTQLLGRKSTNAANIAKRTAQEAAARSTLSAANSSAAKGTTALGVLRGATYALPVLFAGYDTFNEIQEYNGTLKGL